MTGKGNSKDGDEDGEKPGSDGGVDGPEEKKLQLDRTAQSGAKEKRPSCFKSGERATES